MINSEIVANGNDNIITNAEKINSKEENAIIKINTIYIGQDDEEDTTELITKGVYRQKGNLTQIIYQDTEVTGFYDCETKITAKKNDLVSIFRRGNKVGSDLIVQYDKKLYSQYTTPMGSVLIGVMANVIENSFNENGGTLHMKYTIDMNGSFVSENEIDISVELI